jgi:hypothetical protein
LDNIFRIWCIKPLYIFWILYPNQESLTNSPEVFPFSHFAFAKPKKPLGQGIWKLERNEFLLCNSYVKISSRLPRQFCYFDICIEQLLKLLMLIVRSIGFSKSRLFQARCGQPKPGHESVCPYVNARNFNSKNNNTARSSVWLSGQPGFYINSPLTCFFLAIFIDVWYANCDCSNLSTYNTYLYSMLTKLTYARFYDFVARYPEIFDSALWHVQTTNF